MTRISKQRAGGTVLLEEPILEEPVRDIQLEEAATDANHVAECASKLHPSFQQEGAQQPGSGQPGLGQSGFQENTQRGTPQFVTFMAGDEVFAADMVPVKEIIRVPDVVRVPMAPAALKGLANLRGKVLPIISLRSIFGFPEADYDDSTRALVIDVGQPLGFVVDRVASVMGVDSSQIEDVDSIRSTVNTEVLSGLLKDVGGHAMIMVLDFAKLIEREFSQLVAISESKTMAGGVAASTKTEGDQSNDELQLVSFDVDGQEYAIAIEEVQEIVQVPETVIHVPRSESHVLGVMTLRSRLLPLVNLRSMFALPHRDLDEKSRIVVLTLGGVSVGVVVDAVSEVLRVSKSGVDALPALLARDGNLTEITAICRLDSGKRMVAIVTARNLFGNSVVKEALSAVNDIELEEELQANEADDSLDDDEQVVIFRLGKEEFGAPIASVQEIVRVPEALIRVPQAPSFVEGVINLRGSVLPVIDLRLRLGLNQVERTDRQRIMVFLIADVRTGFIVDQVAEVLKIPKAAIEPAPQLSKDQSQLLSRMANLEKQKRMVQLIDPRYLMERKELVALASVTE
jgi:purine-binding chemotaxis protein CheW